MHSALGDLSPPVHCVTLSTMGELRVPRSLGERGGVLSAPGVCVLLVPGEGFMGGGGTEGTGLSESTRVTA